jgi:hypothetical protein
MCNMWSPSEGRTEVQQRHVIRLLYSVYVKTSHRNVYRRAIRSKGGRIGVVDMGANVNLMCYDQGLIKIYRFVKIY